ncbi:unnamed protein product [Ectocarpus sp. 12 AP-2014]
MKIDVGEGTRGTPGAPAEDHQIHACGTGGVERSDASALLSSGSNRRAVPQQQHRSGSAAAAAASAGLPAAEGMRALDGVGGTRQPNGIPRAGEDNGGCGGGIELALSRPRGGGSSRSVFDGTVIVGTQEISQQESNNTTATAGHARLHLKRDPNLAPPEGNGSPGSGTPPADTGGDPCPSCASPHAPHFSSPETVGAAALAAVDSSGLCRCGDKARGGHTGGNPVASADAVAVDSVSGGTSAIGSGYPGHHHHQVASVMVATESGMGSGEADAATVVGAPSMPLQRYVDPRQAALGAPNQQPVGGTAPMMVVDARHGGGGGGGGEPWSVVPQQPEKDRAPVPPREPTPPVATGVSEAKVEIQQQQQEQQGLEQDVKALQADTMDRLAQSLAQAEQLALSVEARQSELLARPKRRSHCSAKQESAAQSRKVRPKSVPQAGKLPKLEDLGIKVEPIGDPAAAAAAAVSATDKTAAVTGVAAPAAAAPAERAASSGLLMPKQRLLIKIPRAAVTAATAHAAEVAAAAKKEDGAAGGETRSTKRGKGKSGVKRARPLAASRASQPPPPPPAPTSRQELPPGCGPPSPSLAAIFGRQVDKEELETAHDGTEHVQTSLASRRVTALSAAAPKELASHVQALRLDYLVQKVRPILTKLMSSGTGPQRGLFNVPVDPLKLGIPDYFKRVPHPMDLGTIKSRLLSMSYTTPEEFASDVRLVFKNAIGFNPETHFVHTWAVQLLNEFDQEYSKQIGKLDEGWAKSLSHSCQLCQGQTCTLCGDKCLKLEPPVIICHHCNKRVVRGGVYHITRDGCRLWCSRCHPGLPPELPTDGDPEGIVAEETAEGGGSGVASTGGGDYGEGGGGVAASGSNTTPAEGGTPQPQPSVATPSTTEGRAAAVGSGVLTPGGVSSPSPVQPPPPGTAAAAAAPAAPAVSTAERRQPARTPSPPSTAAPVEAIANGGGGVNHGSCQNGGGSAPAAGEGGREASPAGAANGPPPAAPPAAPGRAVSESGSANGATGAPPAASESGGSVGGGGATAAAASAVEEVKAPLKRDLLRRKFDEEISEPWVQCDRCNSWVHQVCALFNARANVGEARFVCPLCRLRNVVITKKPGSQSLEAATEGEATTARKRPKSIDGNGNLLPVCPVKTEETPAGASPPVGTATAPAAPEQPAAAAAVAPSPVAAVAPAPVEADAGASITAPPVTSPGEQATEPVNGIVGVFVGGETARAPPTAQQQQQQQQAVGPAPMEGVTPSPLPAVTAVAGTAANTTATTSGGGGGGATPCLDRVLSPPGSTPPAARELPTPPAPAVANGGGAHVPGGTMTPAHAAAPAAPASAAVADPSAPERPVAATVGGDDNRVDGGCVANGEAKATAAAGVGCDKATGEAEVAAAATATTTVSAVDPMEVDEDLGAEAAGDEASGTAGAHSLDVYAASSLPHTPLSRYIESRVRQRLAKLEDEAAASTLSIRLISNVEATCEVHAVLRETFCCKDGLGVGPNKNDVPELLKYRSKALSMFQRVDGVEVCLFSMYVQEYGADAPYFNARRAYISYLDSVEYFRPRKHRTAVYHEILVAYLDWLRRRGFKAAHIWSCPPQRGNNFIFWCHPLHQKTPTRDRLSGWYGNMLKRAVQLGVAAKVTTLDKTHFTEVDRIGILLKNRRTSAAASAAATLAGVKGPDDLPLRPEIPVIFEGDFWAEEAVRLARAVERRDDGQDETQSPLELCRQALEELIRHQHGAPFTAPVDPTRDRCPDYLIVIEQPMDLGTVAETLDSMKYHDAGAFVSDVRLIFDNARKYNPPKHPIHVAASKLAKRSIPWAFDAIGPLSALARKTWAAHSARTARAVGTLPPMSESSPVEVGMPATVPSCRGLSGGATCGGGGGGGSTDKCSAADAPPHSNGAERLSRSGSTAVMSVSEFYGPSGARMLQRRSSTASQLSLADSYGEGETLESASAARENREGQAALTSLISEPLPQQHVAGSNGGVAQAQPAPAAAAARQQPSPPTVGAPAPPSAWPSLTWPPGRQQQQQQQQEQALGPSAAAGSGEAAPGNASSGLTSPVEAAASAATAAALTATPAAAAAAAAASAHPSEASAPVATAVAVAPVPQAPGPTTPGSEVAGGNSRGSGSPPPLTLDPPHPSAANGAAASLSVLNPASAAGATAASTTRTPEQAAKAAAGGSARPASSMSLPWITAPGSTTTAATARPLAEEPMPEDQQQNQRAGILRAMSVDSAPSPARCHARSLSFTGGGGGGPMG